MSPAIILVLFTWTLGCSASAPQHEADRIPVRTSQTSHRTTPPDGIGIDPALAVYVAEYIRDRALARPDLPEVDGVGIRFDTARVHSECHDGAIGCCLRLGAAGRPGPAYIDSVWFRRVGEYAARALVWHELGHCVDGLGHDPAAGRIMHAHIGDDSLQWLVGWADAADALWRSIPGVRGAGGMQ